MRRNFSDTPRPTNRSPKGADRIRPLGHSAQGTIGGFSAEGGSASGGSPGGLHYCDSVESVRKKSLKPLSCDVPVSASRAFHPPSQETAGRNAKNMLTRDAAELSAGFHKPRMTKAVILAAGYATRLYPLTLNIPKPLLYVTHNKTVIDFITDEFAGLGFIDETIIVTNNKFYSHFLDYAGKRPKSRMRLTVINDGTCSNEDRLGAIGDIYFAVEKRKIDSDLLVIAGDNLFESGFKKFLSFAFTKSPSVSLGVFDIKDKAQACRFGVVNIDSASRVMSFEEKPLKPKSALIATCLYFFPKETIKFLRSYARDRAMSNDASGNYIRWLLKVDHVWAFILKNTHWHDIGHLDSYKQVVARYNGKLIP